MNETHLSLLMGLLADDDALVRQVMNMPYLIVENDLSFVDQVQNVTGCTPGIWRRVPWFDDHGMDRDDLNEPFEYSFSEWSNEHNQREVRRIVFGIQFPDYVLVDCLLSEQLLDRVFDRDTMQQVDAWIVKRGLSALDQLGWFSIAMDPDGYRMLFLCDPSNEKWVDQLRTVLKKVI